MPDHRINPLHSQETAPTRPHGWRSTIHEAYPTMTDLSALLNAINQRPNQFYKPDCDLATTQKTGLMLEQYFHHAALLYDQAQEEPDHTPTENHRAGVMAVANMHGTAADMLREEAQNYIRTLEVPAVMRSFGRIEQPQLDRGIPPEAYRNDALRIQYWFERAITLSAQVNQHDYTRDFAARALPAQRIQGQA